jgi:hypothetical protein
MRALALLLSSAVVVIACGSSPSAPSSPSTNTPPVTTDPTPTPTPPVTTPPAATACTTFGGREVTLNRTTPQWTASPLDANQIRLITNGSETNDGRFAYVWVKDGGFANIYAPSDGVLIRIRHKVPNSQFNSEDWDFFFLVACDPARGGEAASIFRFNHITDPRADLRAAFSAGSLPAPQIEPTFEEHEERQVPTTNIRVSAGELLGSTRGTPNAHDFDFQIAINDVTVCPFDPLPEPAKSTLKALLGPGPQAPGGGSGQPQAGYPCTGYGARPIK